MPNPNDYERFVRLFTRDEASVRAFVRSMMPRTGHVDEIMQEVSVVAWRKFEANLGDSEGDFLRWVCTIARFEVLKFRRGLARDRLVLDEDVLSLLADEGLEEITLRSRQWQALDGCLQKLSRGHRELVLRAYTTGQSIRLLSEEIGKTPDSVYQLLRRIRTKLLDCIEKAVELESS
jgi:RNA polymerase sigma-70 factor (ECF subfamily)